MKFLPSASHRWPVAIVTVLIVQIGFSVWMARLAGSDPHFAIEPDYYAKAVHWDDAMAQSRRDKALGWQAAARLLRTGGDAAELQITVKDSTGAPVTLDSVQAEVFAIAHASRMTTVRLAPADGSHAARIAAAGAGLWEVRVRAKRGAELFTARLRTELQ